MSPGAPAPVLLRGLNEARDACHAAGRSGSLGLVPTMGALHDGHISLVTAARAACQTVAVTIFVNPLQFGPGEDLSRYPRQELQDCNLLADAGADLVLLLAAHEMYPPDFATRITQTGLTTVLEGAARPGHFDGVLTVVAKLFALAGPCQAFFGQKDYQQTVVVRRMIDDLLLPVQMHVCPIRRDPDGLALSSRNAFLSTDDRARGLSLVASLRALQASFDQGERDGAVLQQQLQSRLQQGLGHAPDYAALVDGRTLQPVPRAQPGQVALVAGRAGSTRLLDNHVLGHSLPA